ncbi:MAG: NTP transferase domain-containing protein [Chloroflexota bacterium]
MSKHPISLPLISITHRQDDKLPRQIVNQLIEIGHQQQPSENNAEPTNLLPILLPSPTSADQAIARLLAHRLNQHQIGVLIAKRTESWPINQFADAANNSQSVVAGVPNLICHRAERGALQDLLDASALIQVERWAPWTVVILAAGQSSRMGRAKQLVPVEGIPMVVRAVKTALTSGAHRILLITGAYAERVEQTVAEAKLSPHPRLTIVQNSAWKEGQSSSMKRAVRWIMDRVNLHSTPFGKCVQWGCVQAQSPL